MIRVFSLLAVLFFGIALVAAAQLSFARHAFAVSQIPCYDSLVRRASSEGNLLFFGSSRILMGIEAAPFTAVAPTRQIFNLAHNERSYLTDRLLLDEVTRDHRPATVIVEAYVPSHRMFALEREDGFKRAASGIVVGRNYDRLAVAFGRYGDLAIAPAPWPLRWRNELMIAAAKVDQFAGEALSGRLLRAYIVGRRRFDRSDEQVCRPTARRASRENVDIRRRYVASVSPARPGDWLSWPSDQPEFLSHPDDAPARRELRAIVRLARARRIQLVFLYLPSKFIPPPDSAFSVAFTDSIGAPLLVPPRSVLGALQRDGFADEAHLNSVGRRRISQWLAQELSRRRHAA